MWNERAVKAKREEMQPQIGPEAERPRNRRIISSPINAESFDTQWKLAIVPASILQPPNAR